MKRRVLVLSASYGEGHNSAARAVTAALARQPDCAPELIDLFALHSPRLDRFSRRAYLQLINRAPGLWRRAYAWMDRSRRAPFLLAALRSHGRLLAAIIAREAPVALCSTYPAYAWLWNRLPAPLRARCPLHTIITDAITINSLWYRAPSASWCVTDDHSASLLRARGLPADRVHVTGFPVALEFAEDRHEPPPVDDPASRRVLYMVNGAEHRALDTTARLIRSHPGRLTITAGRNADLRARLGQLARAAPGRVEVLGWTDRIPELLMTHHVLVGKAGGATTQEAINALCPMVVNQVVPGQEEGNYELLRRHDAGTLAETPAAVESAVRGLFADSAERWRTQRANLRRLARPRAAHDIARLALAGSPAAVEVAP